jgi:type II secretory pathway pseudopilin PulG
MVVVLGVLFILSLIAAGVAGQLRTQFRAASLNVQVANAQSAVASAFQHQATMLQNALDDAGSSYMNVLSAATPPCDPVDQPWSPYVQYCVRRHSGKLGAASDSTGRLRVGTAYPGDFWQIPVEIRWKLPGSDRVNEVGGWIIIDECSSGTIRPCPASPPGPVNRPRVLYIIHDQTWCQVRPGWAPNATNWQICQAG